MSPLVGCGSLASVASDDVFPQIRFTGILFIAPRMLTGIGKPSSFHIMSLCMDVQGTPSCKLGSTIYKKYQQSNRDSFFRLINITAYFQRGSETFSCLDAG